MSTSRLSLIWISAVPALVVIKNQLNPSGWLAGPNVKPRIVWKSGHAKDWSSTKSKTAYSVPCVVSAIPVCALTQYLSISVPGASTWK